MKKISKRDEREREREIREKDETILNSVNLRRDER